MLKGLNRRQRRRKKTFSTFCLRVVGGGTFFGPWVLPKISCGLVSESAPRPPCGVAHPRL